jgi:hypothetical protein
LIFDSEEEYEKFLLALKEDKKKEDEKESSE